LATLFFAGTSVATVATASAASAHAEIVSTSPVDNTQVATPAQISVTFSEQIVLQYSSLALFDGAGNTVPQDAATLDASGTVMATTIPGSLAAGMYRAAWHNVSVDGHEGDGEFFFEVIESSSGDGTASGPAQESPEPSVISEPEMTIDARAYQSTAGDGPTDSGLVPVQIIGWSALGAGVAAGIAAIVVVFVRRRRVG
jgi:methionine-rich copper-binding protein CopC